MKLKIPHIFHEKELLDKAFSSAREAKEIKIDKKRRIDSVRDREIQRIDTVTQVICTRLDDVLLKTPTVDSLPPFYKEMVSLVIDKEQFKQSLAALKWARNKTKELSIIYKKKIKGTPLQKLAGVRRGFYGRISSLIKQVKKDLAFLDSARYAIKEIPDIKDEPSVLLAGFPNVGKSSLLKALTGANPKIQPYPFTTKGILLGSIDNRIQILDTPGLLERPRVKRNKIELKATAAIKSIAQLVIFVFDVSETAYPQEQQISLFRTLCNEFDIKVITCINKIDSANNAKVILVEKNVPAPVFRTSATKNTGIDELKAYLFEATKCNMKSFRKTK